MSAKRNNSGRIIAENTSVVMGVDVHEKKHIVTIKANGEIRKAAHIAPNPNAWSSYLKRFPGCEVAVVYESGPDGYNLYDQLMEMEHCEGQRVKVVIAPAANVPKAPAKRCVKTDKRDSRDLIHAFETGSFTPVAVPDKTKRLEREVVRTRKRTKDLAKKLKNQIQGKIRFHGVKRPTGGAWGKRWIEELKANIREACPDGILQRIMYKELELLAQINAAIAWYDSQIKELFHRGQCGETARKIQEQPGVGILSAMIVATEAADFSAFKNSDAFASYTGLVPGERSSGETVRRGRITRAGNRRLRWILVECAWTWVRLDPEAAEKYARLKAKTNSRKAIVAMGRRLAVRAYHLATSAQKTEKEKEAAMT